MKRQLKADLVLLSVAIFWGGSFPVMKIALGSIPPYTFLAIRYLVSALLLLPFSYKYFNKIDKKTLIYSFLIGLTLFLGSGLQVIGLQYTTPSKSGFLTGLNVLIVPILIAIIYKKIPELKVIIGIVFSLCGLYIMSSGGTTGINIGDILTILCAFSFGTQIILVDKFTKDINLPLFTFLEMLFVGIMGSIPAISIEGMKFDINFISIGGILYLAIFCTIYAYGLQNKVQKFTTPSHAAIIFLAEPVFGAIFSIFIGDMLTGRTLIGCVFILFGMVIINLKQFTIHSRKCTIHSTQCKMHNAQCTILDDSPRSSENL
ncbi:DMT family transporter [Clostridium sp. DL1XJH146]